MELSQPRRPAGPEFRIPEGLHGRFAIVKLRTNLKTAEDEVIARVKRTAASLGLQCLVVDFMGRPLEGGPAISHHDVDFVIHLHFETPKCYDAFSFAALWNPLQFFHDWGYRPHSQNLATHDDFLSCSSDWADDHVRRLTFRDPSRAPLRFHMYHSLSEPILAPVMGGAKCLFYAGMNWEKLSGSKSRHEEILSLLDGQGLLRIFGPEIVNGIRVWDGYRGYAGQAPFDGVSIVHEIARCGVSLVFSSAAHKESGLMSNRLFETLAAGAIAICDEISFAPKFFGDSLLYVDSTKPVEEVFRAVVHHLDWIQSHPDEAFEKASAAQRIFLEKFSLKVSLQQLYTDLPARKQELRKLGAPARKDRMGVYFLLPDPEDDSVLDRHIESIRAQSYVEADYFIVTDPASVAAVTAGLAACPATAGLDRLTVLGEPLFERDSAGGVIRPRPFGQIVSSLWRAATTPALCVVAPHERMFSDHLERLASALDRDPSAFVACSDVLLYSRTAWSETVTVLTELPLLAADPARPLGFARFLFRRAALPAWAWTAIPYLNSLVFPALLFEAKVERSWRATLEADTQHAWWLNFSSAPIDKELELLKDIFGNFDEQLGPEKLQPKELSLARMQPSALRALAEQIYGVAFPESLEPRCLSFQHLSRSNRHDLALSLYAAAEPDELTPRRLSFDRLDKADLQELARRLRDVDEEDYDENRLT